MVWSHLFGCGFEVLFFRSCRKNNLRFNHCFAVVSKWFFLVPSMGSVKWIYKAKEARCDFTDLGDYCSCKSCKSWENVKKWFTIKYFQNHKKFKQFNTSEELLANYIYRSFQILDLKPILIKSNQKSKQKWFIKISQQS